MSTLGEEAFLFTSSEPTDFSERKRTFSQSLSLFSFKKKSHEHSLKAEVICLKATLHDETETLGSALGCQTLWLSSVWCSYSEQVLERFLGWIWSLEGNNGWRDPSQECTDYMCLTQIPQHERLRLIPPHGGFSSPSFCLFPLQVNVSQCRKGLLRHWGLLFISH